MAGLEEADIRKHLDDLKTETATAPRADGAAGGGGLLDALDPSGFTALGVALLEHAGNVLPTTASAFLMSVLWAASNQNDRTALLRPPSKLIEEASALFERIPIADLPKWNERVETLVRALPGAIPDRVALVVVPEDVEMSPDDPTKTRDGATVIPAGQMREHDGTEYTNATALTIGVRVMEEGGSSGEERATDTDGN